MTPIDIINLALKTSGIVGVGQTPSDEDANDCFTILNNLISEWQVNRWLVSDLIELTLTSTAAASYTVGPTGDFETASYRPDKIDAAFARLTSSGADTPLLPFMSREGYDRISAKASTGAPEAYFYDPAMSNGNGSIYVYPVPPTTYELHLNVKASLTQFATLTDTITLPAQYLNALQWNLAADIRPLYQLPSDPDVSFRAQRSLMAIVNSIAQVPQAVQPTPSNRAGIYSAMPASVPSAPAPAQGGAQ